MARRLISIERSLTDLLEKDDLSPGDSVVDYMMGLVYKQAEADGFDVDAIARKGTVEEGWEVTNGVSINGLVVEAFIAFNA